MLCFLILSVAVHGVPKNILDFVYFLIIIFSFNPVQSVIPNNINVMWASEDYYSEA